MNIEESVQWIIACSEVSTIIRTVRRLTIKEYALVFVDEMILSKDPIRVDFWQQVKQELLKKHL